MTRRREPAIAFSRSGAEILRPNAADVYSITAYVTLTNRWITYTVFAWSLLLPSFFDPPSSPS